VSSIQAIQATGISKQYRIGQREAYGALRDTLARVLSAPARALRGAARSKAATEVSGHFWALKDVSFDVAQGEIVAIIGRNGSGKSTLLKILSRITEPTSGTAAIRGRVGSLLEVGTGFHPELTGRENVFVNGAILGMKRRDILRRFDEI
jgi:lipopolysaccharide transport system ATP-binding protein